MKTSLKDLKLGIVGIAGAFLLVGCITSNSNSDADSTKPLSLRSPGTANHDIKAEPSAVDTSLIQKVTLCHIPPGNRENAHTITVGAPATRAHLDHGDILGACVDQKDSVDIILD